MDKNHSDSPLDLLFDNDKSSKCNAQLQAVYLAYLEVPKTMKEVDRETGVMRENICWYNRTLRKLGKLFAVKKRKCTVTRWIATEWSTNPKYAPENVQLNLFEQ